MSGTNGTGESHSLRGATDRPALIASRDVFDTEEPLATPQLDDFLNPTALAVSFDDGLCRAETARLDVQWTTRDILPLPTARLAARA